MNQYTADAVRLHTYTDVFLKLLFHSISSNGINLTLPSKIRSTHVLYIGPNWSPNLIEEGNRFLQEFPHFDTLIFRDFELKHQSHLGMLTNLSSFHLKEIQFQYCHLGVDQFEVLSNVLPKCRFLTSLEINLPKGNVGQFISYIQRIVRETNLIRLKLTHCRLTDDCIFPELGTIQVLSLQYNLVGNEGVRKLFHNGNQSKHINLSQNQITRDGAIHIANVLPNMRNVEELRIANNNISDGLGEITRVLSRTTLRTIDVNGVSHESCSLPGLSSALNLVSVDLRYNVLSGEGQRELGTLVSRSTVIEYLGVGFRDWNLQECQFILDALKRNNSIKDISLPLGDIGDPIFSAIMAAIKTHRSLVTFRTLTRYFIEDRLILEHLQRLHSKQSEILVSLCYPHFVARSRSNLRMFSVELIRLIGRAITN